MSMWEFIQEQGELLKAQAAARRNAGRVMALAANPTPRMIEDFAADAAAERALADREQAARAGGGRAALGLDEADDDYRVSTGHGA